MMAKQISVFLDNRPGRLNALTGILADALINIRAISIQDRSEFGVVKIIVDLPDKAIQVLQQEGFACASKDIIAVAVEDKVGGLHGLTDILAKNNMNIIDAYGFAAQGIFCIEAKNILETKKLLEEKGYKILTATELNNL